MYLLDYMSDHVGLSISSNVYAACPQRSTIGIYVLCYVHIGRLWIEKLVASRQSNAATK